MSNPGKRESTAATDGVILTKHIEPAIGPRRIDKVKPSDVQALVNVWGANRAPRTVRRMFGVLRAVFQYAVHNDYLLRSPCRNIKLPAVHPARRHELTSDDVGSIAAHLPQQYRPMVWLGAVLGLRWSEVVGLRVRRLDLVTGTLTVAETVTRGTKGRLVFGPPKSTAGNRTMSLPRALVDMLAEHIELRGITAIDADALLFVDDKGGPIHYSNFRTRLWLDAVASAGREGAGFHDLRRLAATSLVLSRVDVKTAQTRLGHSDPRLTLSIYASAPEAADRAAAKALGKRFFAPTARPGGGTEQRKKVKRPG
jgi:integrase